jgi:hypothetical protein
MEWFETGNKPSKGQVERIAGKFGRDVRERLKTFGRKKPTRESLTEALDGLLDSVPDGVQATPPADRARPEGEPDSGAEESTS